DRGEENGDRWRGDCVDLGDIDDRADAFDLVQLVESFLEDRRAVLGETPGKVNHRNAVDGFFGELHAGKLEVRNPKLETNLKAKKKKTQAPGGCFRFLFWSFSACFAFRISNFEFC